MSLIPSRETTDHDPQPRVISVDSDDADDVLSALSAETARKLFAELSETPAPPGEIAERVGTSLQNAQYHLKKLKQAGAVEIVDTTYSEKGREMDIYAPANSPLVICAGDSRQTSGIKSTLTNLLGGFAVVGLLGLFVQQLFGSDLSTFLGREVKSGSTGHSTPQVSFFRGGPVVPGDVSTPLQQPLVESAPKAADTLGTMAAPSLPPGLAFFAGGAVVLLGLFFLHHVVE